MIPARRRSIRCVAPRDARRASDGAVFDEVQGPVHDISPGGEVLPPNRDVMVALQAWDGKGCLVVHMAPQPPGRVQNASGKRIHGVRIEMKTVN